MSSRSAPRPHARHPREQWSSKNRMLCSNAKKGPSVGRNPNFDTEETKLLIQLWGDPKVQRTLITTHKKHVVILSLATKMRQYGYDRSAEEITTRIKNLKCFYNRLKKEMETSKNPMAPTWRHFDDMDEIMTRPIFSVRPNEIPAPSLKYQLEQKREEREQRKRKAIEEGRNISDSDEDIEDLIAVSTDNNDKSDCNDDGIIADAEVDIDAADEAFAALVTSAPKKRKTSKTDSESGSTPDEHDEQDDDGDRLLIKEEFENIDSDEERNSSSNNNINSKIFIEQTNENESQSILPSNDDTNDSCVAMIIPKDEPIEVEDDNDDNDDSSAKESDSRMSANLGNMLKLTQNGMVAISSATGNIIIPVSSVATTSALNSGSKLITTFSNNVIGNAGITNTTSTLKPGKISLVPTNFLMQPQGVQNSTAIAGVTQTTPTLAMSTQSLQLRQMPQRILLSGAQANGQSKTPSTGIVTTGPGGMKVLLVNAETAGAAAGKICMPTNLGQQIVGTNAALIRNTVGNVPNKTINPSLTNTNKQTPGVKSPSLKQQQEKSELKRREEEILLRKRRERLSQREEVTSRREGIGMRNIMRTLLNVQNQNNEIQRQRLNLERERLEFEKNVAERFLTALSKLAVPQQQPTQQQQFINLLQQQAKTQQLCLNPTKLVFTTSTLPTSATVTSNVATFDSAVNNNNNTNEAISTNEIDITEQLLTPKTEKDD